MRNRILQGGLIDLLEALRARLIRSVIAIAVGFAGSYAFKEKIFDILVSPLTQRLCDGCTMIYTSLPEAFFTYLKAALLCGIMLASPVVLYQIWTLVVPSLNRRHRHLLIPVVLLSTLFFTGGACFGYFMVFPFGFDFFMSFASETLRPMLSMKDYLGFAAKLLLAFGLVFEMPLAISFLARLGVVDATFLGKHRKYALLLFFVTAAILTPPDLFTQVMMAVPMILLYELSILGARIFGRHKAVFGNAGEECAP